MRCKIQYNFLSCCISELFFNLRCMAMCSYSICFDIFIHFTVKIRKLCSSSCSRSSRLRIDNQSAHIDQSFLCKRICCQDRTCCITSRIGHDTCILHFVPVDLAQSIDSFINILRCFVFDFIPLFVNLHIFQTEICTEINDLCL